MCSVSVGVEKLRLWWLGVKGKCVLNVDRYVWFVLWGWANRVVGVHMFMTGCMNCSISVCMKHLFA